MYLFFPYHLTKRYFCSIKPDEETNPSKWFSWLEKLLAITILSLNPINVLGYRFFHSLQSKP